MTVVFFFFFYGESLVATAAGILLPIENCVCKPAVPFCVTTAKSAQSSSFKKTKILLWLFFLVASQKSSMTWLTSWTRLTAGSVMRPRG